MLTLENDQLKVRVKPLGAELGSIFSKETNLEYMWSGDPLFWNRKSPVLFPIVGTLKKNTYYFQNKPYTMSRHGFARDMDFQVTGQNPSSATLMLQDNEDTVKNYPFHFRLEIKYELDRNKLIVRYLVTNTGQENIYFSIGAHPAFRIPLEEDFLYDDYYFEFEQIENAKRWLITSEGLVDALTVPFIENSKVLPITKDLFRKDAIVFKYLNSTSIKLKCHRSPHGLDIEFARFPFLGLWAAPGADFVCIEPWCGIADSTTSNQELINKEGINLLTPEQVFKREWAVTLF